MGVVAGVVGQIACAPNATPPAAPDLFIAPLIDAGKTTTQPAVGVRFGHPPATVGTAFRVDLHAKSRSADQESEYTSVFRVEVLEVQGPAPSRLLVEFLHNVRLFQGTPQRTSIDGKGYFVDSRAPHVRTPSGAAATAEETERVLDILPELGTRDRIDEVLPDEEIPLGAHHDELAAVLLRVLHPRAWKLESGTAILTAGGEEATFDVRIVASADNLRMELSGKARVRTSDARLSSLVLSGPYGEVVDAGSPDGTFELTRTITSDPGSRSGR